MNDRNFMNDIKRAYQLVNMLENKKEKMLANAYVIKNPENENPLLCIVRSWLHGYQFEEVSRPHFMKAVFSDQEKFIIDLDYFKDCLSDLKHADTIYTSDHLKQVCRQCKSVVYEYIQECFNNPSTMYLVDRNTFYKQIILPNKNRRVLKF